MKEKRIFYFILAGLLLFILGFLLSSGLFSDFIKYGTEKVNTEIKKGIIHQANAISLYPQAKHYMLLPPDSYLKFYTKGLSFTMFFTILTNALFNALFQPIFISIFTPQVILNYMLFPFFIYGAIKYFKRVPLMVFVFLGISVYIGLHNAVIESLIRHRLSCELIYLLIGLAGFTGWITESLS
jgi:hypothetical protein